MDESIFIENISYILNEEEKTAKIKIFNKKEDHYIPRSIIYQSQEYIITSILPDSGHYIKSIQFAPDSELKTIEKSAFIDSYIESFSFPSSLINLEEGWCKNTTNLTNITISPKNPKYKLYNNNMIIGKSFLDSKNYDTLVFCSRNVKEVTIPNFIEIIEPYALENISKIIINPDSKLREIKNYSIYDSNIESIYIPPSVITTQACCFKNTPNLREITVDRRNKFISIYDKKLLIAKSSPDKENFDTVLFCFPWAISVKIPDFIEVIAPYSFAQCSYIKEIKFSKKSKLRSIEKYAFYKTTIESITIPPHLTKIGQYAFCMSNLLEVNITPDSELRIIESYAFEQNSIKKFFVPPLLTKISQNTFYKCESLTKIEIPENSKLEVIEECAFDNTLIESIHLPQNFKKLEKGWAAHAEKLTKISFSPNNKFFKIIDDKMVVTKSDLEKDNYDTLAFYLGDDEIVKIPDSIEVIGSDSFCRNPNIKEVEIPEKLRIIERGAFFRAPNLKNVVIPLNSQLQEIGSLAFNGTLIESIFIPSHVKKIGKLSFCICRQLKKVEFAANSEIESIEENAFSSCISIESIYFPPSLKNACFHAFGCCTNLKYIEIDPNIELEKLDDFLFTSALIEEFSIPSSVTRICNGAFKECKNLNRIEIPKNSKLEVIKSNAFYNTQIESIFLPSNLFKLQQGWCQKANKLNEIIVDQRNKYFSFVDNKLLLSKSSPEKEKFDILVFCARNVKKVTIPDYIEIIEPYSFNNCNNLINVEISKDSKLRIIGHDAFYNCKKLRKIEIINASKLEIIDDHAFKNCLIETITIPIHVTRISFNAFEDCRYLRNVEFQENSELKIIDGSAFANCSLRNIIFPSFLYKIDNDAFYGCKNLCKVEFPKNSELKIMGKSAFFCTKLKGILLPSHLSHIYDHAFSSLLIVELGEYSDIEFIDLYAFNMNIIIVVPSKVRQEFLTRVQKVLNPDICEKYNDSKKQYWPLLCIFGIFCIFLLFTLCF